MAKSIKKAKGTAKMAQKKSEKKISMSEVEEQLKIFAVLVMCGNPRCKAILQRYVKKHFDDNEDALIFIRVSLKMLVCGMFDSWQKVKDSVPDEEVLQDAFAMAQDVRDALGIPNVDNVSGLVKQG